MECSEDFKLNGLKINLYDYPGESWYGGVWFGEAGPGAVGYGLARHGLIMKIIKIGKWDKNAKPVGWEFDLNGADPYPAQRYIMDIKPTGEVFIGGIEVVPWTNQRKKILGLLKEVA